MATGKFNTMNGKENFDKGWVDLAEHLNSLSADGKTKDIKSWKTVSIYIRAVNKIIATSVYSNICKILLDVKSFDNLFQCPTQIHKQFIASLL